MRFFLYMHTNICFETSKFFGAAFQYLFTIKNMRVFTVKLHFRSWQVSWHPTRVYPSAGARRPSPSWSPSSRTTRRPKKCEKCAASWRAQPLPRWWCTPTTPCCHGCPRGILLWAIGRFSTNFLSTTLKSTGNH